MPARGHVTDLKGNARRAAECYLRSRADGESLSGDAVASRFGIALGTLHSAVKKLRKERAGATAPAAQGTGGAP